MIFYIIIILYFSDYLVTCTIYALNKYTMHALLIYYSCCMCTRSRNTCMLYRQVELEANQAGRARAAGIHFNYFGFQNWRSGSGWPGA